MYLYLKGSNVVGWCRICLKCFKNKMNHWKEIVEYFNRMIHVLWTNYHIDIGLNSNYHIDIGLNSNYHIDIGLNSKYHIDTCIGLNSNYHIDIG